MQYNHWSLDKDDFILEKSIGWSCAFSMYVLDGHKEKLPQAPWQPPGLDRDHDSETG